MNTLELSLTDMTIESNTAGQDGGGIYNTDELHLAYSTVNGNQADRNGGGLYNDSVNSLNLINNTFVDNWADKGGGLYNTSISVIDFCTFSANRADTSGGAVFGDDHTMLSNTILANSLVSGNCGKEAGDDPVENDGNNIDSGTTCGFGAFYNSMSNTDPLLGPLQFNGGRTKTMALQTGSPAIDGVIYGAPGSCIDYDQRHYPRPFGSVLRYRRIRKILPPVYATGDEELNSTNVPCFQAPISIYSFLVIRRIEWQVRRTPLRLHKCVAPEQLNGSFDFMKSASHIQIHCPAL